MIKYVKESINLSVYITIPFVTFPVVTVVYIPKVKGIKILPSTASLKIH